MSVQDLLTDERFVAEDLNVQLGRINSYYDLRKGDAPDKSDALRDEEFRVSGLWEELGKAKLADEFDKPFHVARFGLYSKLKDPNLDPGRKAAIQGQIMELQGKQEIGGREYRNQKTLDQVQEAVSLSLGGGKTPKNLLGRIESGPANAITGVADIAKGLFTNKEMNQTKSIEMLQDLEFKLGKEELDKTIAQVKKERFLEFEGEATRGRLGNPVIKPHFSLEEDDKIRAELEKEGITKDRINSFMEIQLPRIRENSVKLISSLRDADLTETRKIKDDLEYARAKMKEAKSLPGFGGKIVAGIEGVDAKLTDLLGGALQLFGVKEGADFTRQAAATRLLTGAGGHEFFGQIGELVPDLLLALGPGKIAAESKVFRTGLGKVPVLRGKDLLEGVASSQRAGLIGSSIGSGLSAGLSTFGASAEQGDSWGKSFRLGLSQALTTAGVTALAGPTGIEGVFAKGTVGKSGLVAFMKKVLPEAMKEGAEEVTDELLSYFTVQLQIDPNARFADSVEGAIRAFELGALAGGGVNALTNTPMLFKAAKTLGPRSEEALEEVLAETPLEAPESPVAPSEEAEAEATPDEAPAPLTEPEEAEGVDSKLEFQDMPVHGRSEGLRNVVFRDAAKPNSRLTALVEIDGEVTDITMSIDNGSIHIGRSRTKGKGDSMTTLLPFIREIVEIANNARPGMRFSLKGISEARTRLFKRIAKREGLDVAEDGSFTVNPSDFEITPEPFTFKDFDEEGNLADTVMEPEKARDTKLELERRKNVLSELAKCLATATG